MAGPVEVVEKAVTGAGAPGSGGAWAKKILGEEVGREPRGPR